MSIGENGRAAVSIGCEAKTIAWQSNCPFSATRWFTFLVLMVWHGVPAGGQPLRLAGPVTAEQVRAAIEGGKKYLLAEQLPRGNWAQFGRYQGGLSGLCTLALLNAGVEPSHPQMQKALANLRKLKLQYTYGVALQTMALCAATPRRDALLIQENVRWLEAHQIKKGDYSGSWSYPTGAGDNSNAQFAVLALHEGQRVGAQVDPATWRRAAEYWRRRQHADGSKR